MYIKKDFLQLKLDELVELNHFQLCYVEKCSQLDIRDKDEERTHQGLRLFFTNADLTNQWGDDWNDAPYDCNAGWPYDDTSTKDDEGKWHHTKHTIIVLNVTISMEHYVTLPEEYGYNSPFTVENINLGAVAWMFFGRDCKPIYAGDSPLTVYERIGDWLAPCPQISYEYDEG